MVRIEGQWFKDEFGRTLMLRGVNLGGSSKVPLRADGTPQSREEFFDHRVVSFVGRPFPLVEADEHFVRMRKWGFNCLRFVITWEAIEHAGPGQYDTEYLDYVTAVIQRAGEFGLLVIIDPHQDMWSRFSGGDGAPGWTLEAAGFDLETLHETGAAFVQQMHDGPLPPMIWPSNAGKLAAATMFTLFFGGNDFAPQTLVDGEPIQDYFQRHFLAAIGQVAARLQDMPHVLGYGAMNEPLAGYIGAADLHEPVGVLQMGAAPTPWQGMLLGAGIPQQVAIWQPGTFRFRRAGTTQLNTGCRSAWADAGADVWRVNGVWTVDEQGTPQLLRPAHFAALNGHAVDFNEDYYKPFLRRFAAHIREHQPGSLIFVEPALQTPPPAWVSEDGDDIVFAPHWYDVLLLFLKRHLPFVAVDAEKGRAVFSPGLIRRSFAAQLGRLKEHAQVSMGDVPVFIGETGIPFDLLNSKALQTGDFGTQVRALARTMAALEENLLPYALWNYTADNNNEFGDHWNGENLSIFGLDQFEADSGPYSGGRALAAVIRPFAMAVAGEPLRMTFDERSRRFELGFRHNDSAVAPTVIFVPQFHYGEGYEVQVSDGRVTRDDSAQVLIYHHGSQRAEHRVVIIPAATT